MLLFFICHIISPKLKPEMLSKRTDSFHVSTLPFTVTQAARQIQNVYKNPFKSSVGAAVQRTLPAEHKPIWTSKNHHKGTEKITLLNQSSSASKTNNKWLVAYVLESVSIKFRLYILKIYILASLDKCFGFILNKILFISNCRDSQPIKQWI